MGQTVRELVTQGQRSLAVAGVPSPQVDAELLLAHAWGIKRAELGRRRIMGDDVPEAVSSQYRALIERRAARVPLQHLTGVAYFRGLELAVGPGVFVPRPETEVVAQVAIDEASLIAKTSGGVNVVDLCTGSGAIALAIATEVPGAHVWAVELDAKAHEWTARNLADSSVTLVRGDARTALTELDGTIDVVVSNPPYVPPEAIPKDPEVAAYDPAVALYGLGPDGLEVPRGVTQAARRLLKPGGLYVMEHAEVQAAAAREMVGATGGFGPATTEMDLTGRPRMVVARRMGD